MHAMADNYIWYMSSIHSNTSYGMFVDKLIDERSRNQKSKAAGLKCGGFTVCNNAFKQQTYEELNLNLRRYNTARVLSSKSSKTPLLCCRSVKLCKVSMGLFFLVAK